MPRGPLWTLATDEVIEILETHADGLDASLVESRRERFGLNRLPDAIRRSVMRRLAAQLRGFLPLLLAGAAALAALIGDLKDAGLILFVVVFNAVFGALQEHQAENALAALRRLTPLSAHVRRSSVVSTVPAEEVFPGDVVLLEAGDRVPADGRLVVTRGLAIDESMLTGESSTVDKSSDPLRDAELSVAERRNMVFMNTVVARGRGEFVVSATASATESGRVARMLSQANERSTPLQLQLDSLGKRLSVVAVAAVSIVATCEFLRGKTVTETALEAVALGVAAVPDGLPAVVTLALAFGVHRMAGKRAIVKRLSAVETLGATTLICSDKTGTLTLNQMTARAFSFRGRYYVVSGEGYRNDGCVSAENGADVPDLHELMLPISLCNDSSVRDGQLVGDPTEGALMTLALKTGIDVEVARASHPRFDEVPFDPSRKYMATIHGDGAKKSVFVKGAPEVLFDRCTSILSATGSTPFDAPARAAAERDTTAFGSRGLRVLAIAARDVTAGGTVRPEEYVENLTLLGVVGLLDPPRPGARSAVDLCRRAGIAVKIVTGDQPATAHAIAAQLGLEGEVVTGAELDRMDDAAIAHALASASVFARTAPEHKLRLVHAARLSGRVVAVTGDGVNDAPALRSADIGVAMGSGTEVAKQAAAIVLTDDNFETIVEAVSEGRTIYDNIVKFVRFQLSTNMGALITVFAAPLMGLTTPLATAQILWVAMIMDGPPAIALGFDPARAGLMNEPPRYPGASILPWRRLATLLFHAAVMATGTLGVYSGALKRGSQIHATTLAFTTFVLFQMFSALNVRSERESIFGGRTLTNYRLWVALAVVFGLQIGAVHWGPLQSLFQTTALTARDWMLSLLVAGSIVGIEELRKVLLRRHHPIRGFGSAVEA